MVRREKLGRKDTYMYQTRKIGVVGQGHVGAHVANSLLMQGIADELYLCDINEAKVTSEVQDLRDSLSFVPYTGLPFLPVPGAGCIGPPEPAYSPGAGH